MKRRPPQRGAILVMYAIMLAAVLGFAGLALDLGLAYYRQLQLQNAADRIAIAAAQQLNGTAAGVAAALARAQAIAGQAMVAGNSIGWDPAALSFSADPDAGDADWIAAGAASASPAALRFARVDTRLLGPGLGTVNFSFLRALLPSASAMEIGGLAVAGKSKLGVMPLAICAMSTAPVAQRVNPAATPVSEQVEYGFRYGVNYNLLRLNPAPGATSGELFAVNPIDAPGRPNNAANTEDGVLAPFLCSGELAYPSLAGGLLNLRRIGGTALAAQINSRFGTYGGGSVCTQGGAPPDSNVRSYASPSWLPQPVTEVTAQPAPTGPGLPLQTIADVTPPLASTAPGNYGVLWAYGAARSYPSNTPIPRSQINVLYPGTPATSSPGYPGVPPYSNQGAAYQSAPSTLGRKGRRLMYIPLLSCPVPAGSLVQGQVLAVARFLLTAPATGTMLPGEFAGVVDPATLGLGAELYR